MKEGIKENNYIGSPPEQVMPEMKLFRGDIIDQHSSAVRNTTDDDGDDGDGDGDFCISSLSHCSVL